MPLLKACSKGSVQYPSPVDTENATSATIDNGVPEIFPDRYDLFKPELANDVNNGQIIFIKGFYPFP